MTSLVSVSVVTRNRPSELKAVLASIAQQSHSRCEVLVVDNASDPGLAAENRAHCEVSGARYILLDENRGVSGGRNVGLAEAQGDVIVEIDDDALFGDEQCVARAVECLNGNPRIGIVAFRIFDYSSRRMDRFEYPFRNKRRDPGRPGSCAWFIGAGHAFSKRLIETVGTYRDFSPWGHEEQDLALRTLDAGFDLFYLPEAWIWHKKSPLARPTNRIDFAATDLKNRVKVALLNLPPYSAVTYFLIRGLQHTIRQRSVRVMWKALRMLWGERAYIVAHRAPVSSQTVRKLWSLRGQILF